MKTERDPGLVLTTAPFLQQGVTTPRLMTDVIWALAPILAASFFVFGLPALLVVASATAGCLVAEAAMNPTRPRTASLRDMSAALTGVLLGLTLPPAFPLWMAFLGGIVAIGLGKAIWGGLGQNLFNPALVGRAFLQAAFPGAITTWSAPRAGVELATLPESTLALPFTHGEHVDAMSGATPLGAMKMEHIATAFDDLLLGDIGGSLGETSALLIICAGIFLAWRRTFDWRIPVSILASVGVLSGILWAISPERYPSPLFMMLSGGLLFGAVFMATDPVTSPMTPMGVWLFGAGIGVLVVLIRLFGGLPEGVMYAILLMNAGSPLIDRVTQPRPFGRTAPETGVTPP